MAEDVIDIRKRIEEIRNEVSTAINDGGETIIQSRPAGEVAEFSVPGVTAKTATTATANASVPDYDLSELPQTKSGLDDALKMPSFQLNVRTPGPTQLLQLLGGLAGEDRLHVLGHCKVSTFITIAQSLASVD